MSTAILRIETRDRIDSALLRHVVGFSRPDNAEPLPLPDGSDVAVELGPGHQERGWAALRAALEARKGSRGRPPSHGIEMLFAGPPPWKHPGAWSLNKVRQWMAESVRWAERTFPGMLVHTSALHCDERSPHVHLIAVPLTRNGELSWKRVLQEATGLTDNRKAMSAVQDSYHATVGQAFNLDRGGEGSKRRRGGLVR